MKVSDEVVFLEEAFDVLMNTPWRMVRADRWSWCIVAV